MIVKNITDEFIEKIIRNKKYELAVVMPVYNEQDCVIMVIESWLSILPTIRFKIILLNDGSKDDTLQRLKQYQDDDRLLIIDKPNDGHGPTILLGYQIACKIAEWVFQCDSDGEMAPDAFLLLWEKRKKYSALFGYRQNRHQNASRKMISVFSRFSVKLLFGTGIKDVNTPFRLINSILLAKILSHIPERTFAPNILISAVLNSCGIKTYQIPVKHSNRKTGTVSIVRWRLIKSAVKAFLQTVMFAITFKYTYRIRNINQDIYREQTG